MTVRSAPPVHEEPAAALLCWSVLQLPDGDRHLAGVNVKPGIVSSRVTSAITIGPTPYDDDPELPCWEAVTASGRTYLLVGPARPLIAILIDPVARWCVANGLDPEAIVDVSTEYADDAHPSRPDSERGNVDLDGADPGPEDC